jgi:hypothetical protein
MEIREPEKSRPRRSATGSAPRKSLVAQSSLRLVPPSSRMHAQYSHNGGAGNGGVDDSFAEPNAKRMRREEEERANRPTAYAQPTTSSNYTTQYTANYRAPATDAMHAQSTAYFNAASASSGSAPPASSGLPPSTFLTPSPPAAVLGARPPALVPPPAAVAPAWAGELPALLDTLLEHPPTVGRRRARGAARDASRTLRRCRILATRIACSCT